MAALDLSGHRILLVDDITFARETVRRALRTMNEPEILEAPDGSEALKILKSDAALSFIICDFNMPVANGLQLLKAIRTGGSAAPRSFPVALLTGHSDQPLVERALALDVNGFIIKPVSADALARRIERMLELQHDTSWLKPVAVYRRVQIPPAPRPRSAREAGAASPPATGQSALSGKFDGGDLAPLEEPAAAGKSALSGKFSEGELAGAKLGESLARAIRPTPDEATADGIRHGVSRLVIDAGTAIARSLVAIFEALLGAGRLSTDHIARVFAKEPPGMPARIGAGATGRDPAAARDRYTALDDIAEGAILSGDLVTSDGRLVLPDGTPLTAQLVAAIRELARIDALDHHGEPEAGPAGMLKVRYASARTSDGAPMLRVEAVKVRPGETLARDLFLNDGRPYMVAEASFTPRGVSLLRDLTELGHFRSGIWIKS